MSEQGPRFDYRESKNFTPATPEEVNKTIERIRTAAQPLYWSGGQGMTAFRQFQRQLGGTKAASKRWVRSNVYWSLPPQWQKKVHSVILRRRGDD